MKRERRGGQERARERERRGREVRGRGRTGGEWVKKGGYTVTSHELNRTANSSTREGVGGGDRGGGGLGWCLKSVWGEGGTDRFYITLRTHTHTKKTGHKLHFRSKLHGKSDFLSFCMTSRLFPAVSPRERLSELSLVSRIFHLK